MLAQAITGNYMGTTTGLCVIQKTQLRLQDPITDLKGRGGFTNSGSSRATPSEVVFFFLKILRSAREHSAVHRNNLLSPRDI